MAYLAGTITLGIPDGALTLRPRLQPLYIPRGTPLIAVVRVESPGRIFPSERDLAQKIHGLIRERDVRALQIDFDAHRSERPYYRRLLEALKRLDPNRAVEMTALVSWCEGDRWLHDLPVTDAIPMFFRMGADPHATNETMNEPLCRSSIGIATDEFHGRVPAHRRVFVFSQTPWSESSYQAVLRASQKWFAN